MLASFRLKPTCLAFNDGNVKRTVTGIVGFIPSSNVCYRLKPTFPSDYSSESVCYLPCSLSWMEGAKLWRLHTCRHPERNHQTKPNHDMFLSDDESDTDVVEDEDKQLVE